MQGVPTNINKENKYTWQTTGQSNSSIGYKEMLTAAKAMALSAIRTAYDSRSKGRSIKTKWWEV